MKEKNTVTLDEIGGAKERKQIKFNYLKFLKKHLLTKIVICVIVSIVLTIIFTIPSVNGIKELGCTEIYCSKEEITISQNFMSRAQTLLLTGVASMVPYFYLPALGLISYMNTEIISVAHVINVYGYLMGIVRYILPFKTHILP